MTSSALNGVGTPADVGDDAPRLAPVAPLVIVTGPEQTLRQLAPGLEEESSLSAVGATEDGRAADGIVVHDLGDGPPAAGLLASSGETGRPQGPLAAAAVAEIDRQITVLLGEDLTVARARLSEFEQALTELDEPAALGDLFDELDTADDELDPALDELRAVERQLDRLDRLAAGPTAPRAAGPTGPAEETLPTAETAAETGPAQETLPADETAPAGPTGETVAASERRGLEDALRVANTELEAAAEEANAAGRALARFDGLPGRAEVLQANESLGRLRDVLEDRDEARAELDTAARQVAEEAAAQARTTVAKTGGGRRGAPPWLQAAALGTAASLIVLAVVLLLVGATTAGAATALAAVVFAAVALAAPPSAPSPDARGPVEPVGRRAPTPPRPPGAGADRSGPEGARRRLDAAQARLTSHDAAVSGLAADLRLPPVPRPEDIDRRQADISAFLEARRQADLLTADLATARGRFVDADEERSRLTARLMELPQEGGQADGPPDGDPPGDDDLATDHPPGDQPGGDGPAGHDPASHDPAGDGPDGHDPAGDGPDGDDPGDDQASSDPGDGHASSDPEGDDPEGDDPDGDDPDGDEVTRLWRRQRDDLASRRDRLVSRRDELAGRRREVVARLSAQLDDPTPVHLVQARQATLDVLARHARELDRLVLARWFLTGPSGPPGALEEAATLVSEASAGSVTGFDIDGGGLFAVDATGARLRLDNASPDAPVSGGETDRAGDVVLGRTCLHLAMAARTRGPSLLLGLELPADERAAQVLAAAIARLADRAPLVVMAWHQPTVALLAAARPDAQVVVVGD